jgi:hypothetical protein
MGKVKLRYYTLRRRSGKVFGYWQPSKAMREAGFPLVPCGREGPEAWRIAEEWNRRWDQFRNVGDAPRWPVGSVGAAFDEYRRTGTWAAKALRTKEDWDRGWKYVAPIFGDIAPDAIALAHLDAWYCSIVQNKGVREGWRALKVWRALWGAMAALGYCHTQARPV